DIRCTRPQQLTRQLSGGNQQKVCVARALGLDPEILFVSEPTRGIDVGAKKLVLDLLLKLNKELGMTIIMTSSELVELRSICDRIAIIFNGKVAGILKASSSDREFGLMMAGEYQNLSDQEVNPNDGNI
ncbi:MAG TPA: ATP-binding cassette domain-containing protein, partial [Atribacterota bacterium]|nr:ATP-binding cassette domain-containing protein [Atribacterota bacterium]